MKNNILQIDCASMAPKISLAQDGIKVDTMTIEGNMLTDSLLTKIDEILCKNKIVKADLTAIEVSPGPGSYTSLRVGLTTANMLAYSLNIPIAPLSQNITSDKYTSPVMPKYGNTPNITKPKTRLE